MLRHKRESLGRFDDLQAFVHQVQSVKDNAGLRALLEDLIQELGFSYFALFHHVVMLSKGIVRMHNYRSEWQETVSQRKYFLIDPVHVISQRSAAGFRWSDFPRYVRLSDRQIEMQDEARRAGIANGFTVPINVPGEHPGSISFATRPGVDFPYDSLPVANFLAPIAFDAAKRIANGPEAEEGTANVSLTARELDCIALVAQGKSDKDIGTILGVSAATARFHVDNARKKMNVATRTQLVVGALFANQLTFTDILPGEALAAAPLKVAR